MAQKYLMALDYVDLHADTILQKHAKKRPLGDIETKHRFTPTQPVLSCRTVDIDVSGTRTYRPKSSADIISEQHALIHKIYTKARNIASAPPRRPKTPKSSHENDNKQSNKENKLKSVEVQGRPLTSLSQRPGERSSGRTSKTPKKRPKTTGHINKPKPVSENFMIVRADKDLIETRRSYRSVTDKIHKHWKPENHDLNTGTFQRGKKQPGIQAVDSWLTFSGSQEEEAEGIVDAFADVERQGEFYNIEGGVGSRIAQQLQKGDKIRIGINGSIQSQDLKVKKWLKEDSYIDAQEDMKEPETPQKEKSKKEVKIIPLCWDDTVETNGAKVITPRGPPADSKTINLCETRPVVFRKLIPDENGTNGVSSQGNKKEGYRVKQRKKTKPCVDGKERENRVTVVTIDSKTEEDEKKIECLTVDEVLKSCQSKSPEKQNGRHEDMEKHSVTFSMPETENHGIQDGVYNTSRTNFTESVSSGSSDYGKVIVKPSQPTFSSKYQEVDLDIIGTLSVPNGTRPLSSETTPVTQQYLLNNKSGLPYRPPQQMRTGSARSSRSSIKTPSAKSGLGSGSIVSLGSQSFGPQGFKQEPEFIQISQPVKNPNPNSQQQQRKSAEFMTQGLTQEMMRSHTRSLSGVREPVPSPELENYEMLEQEHPPLTPPPLTKPANQKPQTPALSINIPTADYTDSALNSPSHKQVPEPNSSPQRSRANNMRDEQIDQITTLLVDAIIGPNDGQQGPQS